jgi:hypothetical protein
VHEGCAIRTALCMAVTGGIAIHTEPSGLTHGLWALDALDGAWVGALGEASVVEEAEDAGGGSGPPMGLTLKSKH